MDNLHKYYFEDFKRILNEYDHEEYMERISLLPDSNALQNALSNYTKYNELAITYKSVLGIDIYRYSKYPSFKQILIPVIFQLIYEKAIDYSVDYNRFVFQKYSKEIINSMFISTGDGGFQIFNTPLHSLLFAINFSIALRQYNSFHFYPKLRNFVGEINLRYTLTYDEIYSYEQNFFGSSIINNSRILSKDQLNRCLIDQNTFDWFMLNFNGIENLEYFSLNDLLEIEEFCKYNKEFIALQNYILHNDSQSQHGIKSCDIQKIDDIMAKETKFSIYNLCLKVLVKAYDSSDETKKKIFNISLGNINSSGF